MLNALRRADTLDAGCDDDDDDIRVVYRSCGRKRTSSPKRPREVGDTENGSDMGTSVHSRREPGTAREEEEEDEWTQVRAENARRIRRAEARHMHSVAEGWGVMSWAFLPCPDQTRQLLLMLRCEAC